MYIHNRKIEMINVMTCTMNAYINDTYIPNLSYHVISEYEKTKSKNSPLN